MSSLPVIGFIGVGLMGHGMAKNIRLKGYPLVVKGNRNRQPVEDLLALGATEASSPRQMAQSCDIIHLCLPNSKRIEECFRAKDGILNGARPGLVVVDSSTAAPASTLALAEELAAVGGHLVDAPLGGTPAHAEEGKLSAMLGGEAEVIARIRPVIETWAQSIQHIGPVGSGHKMKLLMNFVGLSYGALYSELVVLGAKIGIAPQQIYEALSPSRMGSGFFETFMAYVIGRDRDAHKFSLENAAKDMGYIADLAGDAAVMNLISGAARQYYSHALSQGKGADYVPMLSDLVGKMNGIDLERLVQEAAAR